jgi:hypothetical protein
MKKILVLFLISIFFISNVYARSPRRGTTSHNYVPLRFRKGAVIASNVREVTIGENLLLVKTNNNEVELKAAPSVPTPAGSDKEVQFNDAGVLGAEAGFEYNKGTDYLTVPNLGVKQINAIDINGLKLYEDGGTGIFIEDGGNIGIGENIPDTQIEMTSIAPYFTSHNSTNEDIDGGRESRHVYKGHQSGGEESTLAIMDVSHKGTGDDQEGQIRFFINSGFDGDVPDIAHRFEGNSYYGNFLFGNKLTIGDTVASPFEFALHQPGYTGGIDSPTEYFAGTAWGDGGAVFFGNTDRNTQPGLIFIGTGGTSPNQAPVQFFADKRGATLSDSDPAFAFGPGLGNRNLFILGGGNIGINIQQPIEKFEVAGGVRYQSLVYVDEMDAGLSSEWAVDTSTGSGAAQSKANGFYRLLTGALATNEESRDWDDITTFINTQRPNFEVELQLEQTTVIEAEFGMKEDETVGSNDYIKIFYDASVDGNWHLEVSNAGSTSAAAGAAATTSIVIIRLIFTSDTAVEWYINGVSQGTIATNIPTVLLQPFMGVRTEEASAHYVDWGFFKVTQDRS